MGSAIAERSDERKRYTPYYYLGLALFELGDCDGALTSWQESERQGALGKDELAKVRDGRAKCLARLDQSATLAATERGTAAAVEQAVASAAALRSAVSADIAGPWQRGEPSLADRQRSAEARLESVRSEVDQARARRDGGALAVGERAARAVAKELDDLRAQAVRLQSERGAQLGDLRTKADTLVAAAREALRTMTDLAPFPPQVRRKRADLESLLSEVGSSIGAADDAYLQGLISRLSFSLQQLKDVTAGPPAALSEAASSFFSGDYARVLEVLAAFAGDSPRARAHSLLLRSAAGYYLWVEQGESDQELLGAAAADAAACLRLDAKLRPAPALFSPRFLEFFAKAVASPEPP